MNISVLHARKLSDLHCAWLFNRPMINSEAFGVALNVELDVRTPSIKPHLIDTRACS